MKSFLIGFLTLITLPMMAQKSSVAYITIAKKLQTQANAYYQNGKYVQSYQRLKDIEKIYLQNKDEVRLCGLNYNFGSIEYAKGDYKSSIAFAYKGLKNPVAKPDSLKRSFYYLLGISHKKLSNFDSTAIYYEKVKGFLDIDKSGDSSEETIKVYKNIGQFYLELNDYQKAENYVNTAIALVQKTKLTELKAQLLNTKAYINYLEGNQKNAVLFFKKAILTTQNPINQYLFGRNLALSYIQLADFTNAQHSLNNAQKVYQNLKQKNAKNYANPYDEIQMFQFDRANIFFFQQDYTNAATLYEQTIKKCQFYYDDKLPEAIYAYMRLAEIALKKHDFLKAANKIQQALASVCDNFQFSSLTQNPSIDNIVNKREAVKVLAIKAKIWYGKYKAEHLQVDLVNAYKTYEIALKLAEEMRMSFDSDKSKYFISAEYLMFRQEAVDATFELMKYRPNLVFQQALFSYIEGGRASVISDWLRLSKAKAKSIPETLLAKERALNHQITGLELKLSNKVDKNHIEKLRNELDLKKLAQSRLLENYEKQYPTYKKLKFTVNDVSIKEIQSKLLTPNSALISYFFTEGMLYIVCIDDKQTKVYNQLIDSVFVSRIKHFRKVLTNSPAGRKYDGQALSTSLYDILIQPIEKEIVGKKRLIIIRDAELNYIPFEVLAKQKDDFLLKKHIISYAYSASLLMPSTTNKKQVSGLLGFAPFANTRFQQSLFRDKNLGQLPKSGEEIEKIGGDIYLENEATKKRFYENYRDKNIIHFATHAITDDADPLKSFIAFYPDSVDYKLFTNELYDLDLQKTNLVMLSACETGVGKLQKGEGVMSLARAFTYAGAKAVITTLWNAHDEASAYISERFYTYLKKGLKTDEALQKAKIDFLNSDLALRYEHPYYWANFILIGPAESIEFGMNWWVWVFSIIFLLFLFSWLQNFGTKVYLLKKRKPESAERR